MKYVQNILVCMRINPLSYALAWIGVVLLASGMAMTIGYIFVGSSGLVGLNFWLTCFTLILGLGFAYAAAITVRKTYRGVLFARKIASREGGVNRLRAWKSSKNTCFAYGVRLVLREAQIKELDELE